MSVQYLLCGLSEINVEDWRKNTNYVGYKETDDIVVWFWKVCAHVCICVCLCVCVCVCVHMRACVFCACTYPMRTHPYIYYGVR